MGDGTAQSFHSTLCFNYIIDFSDQEFRDIVQGIIVTVYKARSLSIFHVELVKLLSSGSLGDTCVSDHEMHPVGTFEY